MEARPWNYRTMEISADGSGMVLRMLGTEPAWEDCMIKNLCEWTGCKWPILYSQHVYVISCMMAAFCMVGSTYSALILYFQHGFNFSWPTQTRIKKTSRMKSKYCENDCPN